MGIPVENRTPVFAFSSAIAVINGVVGGAAVAIALGALADAALAAAAIAGVVVAIASVVGWIAYADRLLDSAAEAIEPLFPSLR